MLSSDSIIKILKCKKWLATNVLTIIKNEKELTFSNATAATATAAAGGGGVQRPSNGKQMSSGTEIVIGREKKIERDW